MKEYFNSPDSRNQAMEDKIGENIKVKRYISKLYSRKVRKISWGNREEHLQ